MLYNSHARNWDENAYIFRMRDDKMILGERG
ncbi:hypothetical protein PAPH110629_02090 [Paenibacillus phoenicis]|jgi:hypothetical protein